MTDMGDIRPTFSTGLSIRVLLWPIHTLLGTEKINTGVNYSFIHSFIRLTNIYIAPLQGYYSEALPTLARLKRRSLTGICYVQNFTPGRTYGLFLDSNGNSAYKP